MVNSNSKYYYLYWKKKAFFNCSSLILVTFDDFNAKIEDDVFSNCIALDHVLLANNYQISIFKFAFPYQQIKKVEFEIGITYITDGAFSCCSSLDTIVIPNAVYSIGSKAFSDYCS